MKRFFIIFVIFICISTKPLFAASYVLPYPSSMPGNLNYKMHLLWESVMKYWYFGSFGAFTYNLKESDKYLVESKTLFEYQQYLLGYKALEKSNMYFLQTLPNLEKAKREGKDVSEKRNTLHDAALKHEEILKIIKNETPETFIWSPEKSGSSKLDIHQLIQQSLSERNTYL